MLRLSNTARRAMTDTGGRLDGLGAAALERLTAFISVALAEERRGAASLAFDTIKAACLDKMVAQIVGFAAAPGAADGRGGSSSAAAQMSPRSLSLVSRARELQWEWHRRFRIEYFAIDRTRAAELVDSGALREVEFVPPPRADMRLTTSWRPRESNVNRDIEGSLGFQVGQYVGRNGSYSTKGRWAADVLCVGGG